MIHFIILSIPWIAESPIEAYFEKKKGKSVSHFWTAVLRGIVMMGLSVIYDYAGTNDWWRVLILQIMLHFMFFNYTYNALTGRKLSYLRNEGIDKTLQIFGWVAVLWFQVVFLASAIMIYLHIPF